jgi:hypothetical protein
MKQIILGVLLAIALNSVAGADDGTYPVCASCPTEGWSSDPMSVNDIEDHLTAMCCQRHLAEFVEGSQWYFAACDLPAYDWDCARFGGTTSDGSPGCPGEGLAAQKWTAFFDFGSAPTFAHYTGAAAGTCGDLQFMGIRYQ